MKVRAEKRRALVWILQQPGTFYAIEMAQGLGITPESCRKSLQRMRAKGLIDHVDLDVTKVYYAVADRALCEMMAEWQPKPANGYVSVKNRPVKRMINSVWSLGA